MVKGNLNNIETVLLVDSGASRSCVSSSFIGLQNCKLSKNTARLLCANGEQLNCSQVASLKLKLGNKTVTHEFLVVPNLSAQVILGLDYIRSLEIHEKQDYVIINGDRLPLYKHVNWKYGTIAHTCYTEPFNASMRIRVKNPFANDKNIRVVSCEPFDHQTHKKYILNPSVHSNDEFLEVIISNNSFETHLLPERSKICKIDPISEESINGLLKLDEQNEIEDVKEFQNSRLEKYGFPNEVSVNSFGEDLNSEQHRTLKELLLNKHLALAKESSDIGRISQ